MNIQLVMVKENGQVKEFPLDTGKTVIGRREECDLRIPLPEISRRHAMMIVTDKAATLRDLGSANGTYVNNKRIHEEELSAGDHIVLGPVVFTVRINGQPATIRPVHTRLEARSRPSADVVTQPQKAAATAKPRPLADDEHVLDDQEEEDPISALEALANSDDTTAINIEDSSDGSGEFKP